MGTTFYTHIMLIFILLDVLIVIALKCINTCSVQGFRQLIIILHPFVEHSVFRIGFVLF